MKALILALLVACTPAQRVTGLALASSSSILIDWHQTHDIAPRCLESNPVIGECGQGLPVNIYFPVVLTAHLAVGYMLPEHWRIAWFAAIGGMQASTVWSNWRAK